MSNKIVYSTKDNFLAQTSPTTSYGTSVALQVKSLNNSLFKILVGMYVTTDGRPGSISPYPIIDSATLYLYSYSGSTGRTITCQRVIRTSWSESSTWNTYDGTNSWGTAGASNATSDYTATDSATAASVATGNWISFNVKAQVQTVFNAIGSGTVKFDFLLSDLGSSSSVTQAYYSKEQGGSTIPYLSFDYHYENIKTVNGLSLASSKTLRSGLLIASVKTWNGLT